MGLDSLSKEALIALPMGLKKQKEVNYINCGSLAQEWRQARIHLIQHELCSKTTSIPLPITTVSFQITYTRCTYF